MEAVGDDGLATVDGHRDPSGVLTLAIAGELDLASIGSVHEAIDEAVDGNPERIVFDLGGVTFMDSSGIAMMLQVSKRVGNVEVRNVTPIVRRVIEATGLVEVLGLEP
jgi:anti-anti-sigma factor